MGVHAIIQPKLDHVTVVFNVPMVLGSPILRKPHISPFLGPGCARGLDPQELPG